MRSQYVLFELDQKKKTEEVCIIYCKEVTLLCTCSIVGMSNPYEYK